MYDDGSSSSSSEYLVPCPVSPTKFIDDASSSGDDCLGPATPPEKKMCPAVFNLDASQSSLQITAALSSHVTTSLDVHTTRSCSSAAVAARLANPICKCKIRSCKTSSTTIPRASLQSICDTFWRLSYHERGHMMRHMYEEVAPNSAPEFEASKVQWALCNVRVCFQRWAHLMGTCGRTVRKWIHGIPDMRRSTPGACATQRDADKSHKVEEFLLHMYLSEGMIVHSKKHIDVRCVHTCV